MLVQIGDLRSGSPKLEELNHYIRMLHNKRGLDVLSFSEVNIPSLLVTHFVPLRSVCTLKVTLNQNALGSSCSTCEGQL